MRLPPRIPLFDLRPDIAALEDELLAAMGDVLRSGRYILGPNVSAFEAEAASYLGCEHAVGLNSGTDALIIGLRALGVGPGDEVITSAFTFVATAEAICNVGAVPVFADIDPKTFNLDPAEVERGLTPGTRAILPVHLYGRPADLDAMLAVGRSRGVGVLEDAAQAFGAELDGRKVGAIGDAGAFSFFPTKPLGGFGDGGLLVTNDDRVAQGARTLRQHGSRTKHRPDVVGYNSRLDELQAAVLRLKLGAVDEWTRGRQRAAGRYGELLAPLAEVVTPAVADGDAAHLYTVRVRGGRRDHVQRQLASAGIETRAFYEVPLHRTVAFAQPDVALPETERAAAEVLCLPLWPSIGDETIEEVVSFIVAALG